MDPFTHALSSLLMSALLGLQPRYGPFAVATLVAASLAPDLDALPIILGQKYFYQYHRVLFHSLSGVFLLGIGISLVIYLFTPLKDYPLVLALSLIGVLLHLGTDLLASWKIPLLSPFNSQRFSLDLVWFIDLPMLSIMCVALFFMSLDQKNVRLFASGALILMIGYGAFRYYQQKSVSTLIQRQVIHDESAVLVGIISPRLGLFNWHAVVQREDSYLVYDVHFCLAPVGFRVKNGEAGGTRILSSLAIPLSSSPDQEVISSSQKAELVNIFLKRARYPIAQVKQWGSGYWIEWEDVHLMLSGGGIRGVIVDIDEQCHIIGQRFKLKPELEMMTPDTFPGEEP